MCTSLNEDIEGSTRQASIAAGNFESNDDNMDKDDKVQGLTTASEESTTSRNASAKEEHSTCKDIVSQIESEDTSEFCQSEAPVQLEQEKIPEKSNNLQPDLSVSKPLQHQTQFDSDEHACVMEGTEQSRDATVQDDLCTLSMAADGAALDKSIEQEPTELATEIGKSTEANILSSGSTNQQNIKQEINITQNKAITEEVEHNTERQIVMTSTGNSTREQMDPVSDQKTTLSQNALQNRTDEYDCQSDAASAPTKPTLEPGRAVTDILINDSQSEETQENILGDLKPEAISKTSSTTLQNQNNHISDNIETVHDLEIIKKQIENEKKLWDIFTNVC